jgi:sugar phosphate isomerase/epimerase
MKKELSKRLSGFADEAGDTLDLQIEAHRRLGWEFLDLRKMDGREIVDIPDDEFHRVAERLEEANLRVSSIGSPIGNRNSPIGEPFQKSLEVLEATIPRMHRLGTRILRVMTYPNDGRSEESWKAEVVGRMRKLAKVAEDGKIVLGVENCAGWAGTSVENYRALFEMVDSPALKAVFDLGNPSKKNQISAWQWYQASKPFLVQVHVKVHTGGAGGKHVWPASGASNINEILQDLLASGFEGFLSIEPHLDYADAEERFQNYIQYGHQLKEMLKR